MVFDSQNQREYQSEEYIELINRLKQNIPKKKDWLIYDHCSVVTKLYAIYESLVENLITEYITILPTLYSYQDLPEKIKNTHREGVGRLLREITKSKYKDLTITQIINGLYAGVNDLEKYDLLPQAFIFHEQNLRLNILEKLLAQIDFDDIKQWITRHREIRNFTEQIRQTTVESELNILINYRNEAAHGGVVEDFLGFNELIELCDFVQSFCIALVELFEYKTIKYQENVGKAKKVGEITEWYKNPQAGVATIEIENATLAIEDNVILLSEIYCQSAIIKSLKNEQEEAVNTIETNSIV